MFRFFSVAVICGVLLHISPVNAASNSGEYAVKGVGLATCQMFMDEKEKTSNRYFQFVGWVVGYLSSHNRYAKDVTDIDPGRPLICWRRLLAITARPIRNNGLWRRQTG
jgi:hypothetical protein